MSKNNKLVRDSFTIPKAEYAAIEMLKERALTLGQSVKKSELLRAGLMLLQGLNDAAYLNAMAAVPTLKTGRPSSADALAGPAADKPAANAVKKVKTPAVVANKASARAKPATKASVGAGVKAVTNRAVKPVAKAPVKAPVKAVVKATAKAKVAPAAKPAAAKTSAH
jgi:hypothetical protein